MERPIENNVNSLVGHSGNSDVDLVVNIDIHSKAIAYGMLCSLYAKGEITELELERAIEKLDYLLERDTKRKKSNKNHVSEHKPKPTLIYSPQQNSRGNWF